MFCLLANFQAYLKTHFPKTRFETEAHGILTSLQIIALLKTYVDDFLVSRTGQTIVKHSETLVLPQSYKLRGIVEPVGCAEAQSLSDAGQIPQVENVVKL